MSPETLQPGGIGAKSSRTTGVSTNAPTGETPQQPRHQLVHQEAAIVGTENMSQDAHIQTVQNPEAASLRSSMQSDVSQLVLM